MGQKITGRHPAVVLSTIGYTAMTGFVAVSPITHATNNRLKDFFIPIHSSQIDGYINPLQFYTFSITKRHLQFTGEAVGDLAFAQLMAVHQQLLNI